jgi:hypothetical protein
MNYNRYREICSALTSLGIFRPDNNSEYVLIMPGTEIRMTWTGSSKCYFDIGGTYQIAGERISVEHLLEIVDDENKKKIIFNFDLFSELSSK